ncbi:hypothetical protein [Hyphomicrobium sp. MC1]|uniref:hypothetical protein n=1 Tax=Hyphomicrobium sp. (strain MC1) TaxID=717785 RepID=UPI000213EAEC|nr:hypothetical protein [Hyphomicrobium sp. MC1]CCB64099.1 conserved protein of unknown function [Hyphomicrobium sp. MC1]
MMRLGNQSADEYCAGGVRWSRLPVALLALIAACVGGCSGQGANMATLQSPTSTPPTDVAVRSAPVVPGRRARVFIFAGLGDKCEQLAAPEIAITQPPAKGDLAFVPGQQTTIEYSAKGTCIGKTAIGTGIYYTARDGTDGTDSFAVTAKLASGETVSRSFRVTIAP